MKLTRILAAGAMSAAVGLNTLAATAEITGAGATFPYPIYAKWADAYKKSTGNGMNYQSIGSGGGIKQITAKTVDFGASDMPMKPEDLQKNGLVQFPAIMGGVVPVVKIEGVKPGALKFTGPVLADIYLGKITKWNDPAIAKLNPGVKLPADPITVVYRSDGSGTTFLWTNYLSKVSPEFKTTVGEGTSVPRAWAARATRAWLPTCRRSTARSATSSTPTRSRTSSRTDKCRTRRASSSSPTISPSRPRPPAPIGNRFREWGSC